MNFLNDAFHVLKTPFLFLRVKHPVKHTIGFWIPLLVTFTIVSMTTFIPFRLNVFGNGGLVAGCTALLQVLSGFYIASLAAVATFQKDDLDKRMEGDAPTLAIGNKKSERPLTRREFLCYLFGYLAILSILMYFSGTIANSLANDYIMHFKTRHGYVCYLRPIGSAVYCFGVVHLVSMTFLGLHFLVYRMHKSNRAIATVFDNEEPKQDEEINNPF